MRGSAQAAISGSLSAANNSARIAGSFASVADEAVLVISSSAPVSVATAARNSPATATSTLDLQGGIVMCDGDAAPWPAGQYKIEGPVCQHSSESAELGHTFEFNASTGHTCHGQVSDECDGDQQCSCTVSAGGMR